MTRVLILLLLLTCCFADSPARQKDYSVASPNGEFILVVFTDESWKEFSVPDLELRKKYKVAGIYTKDGKLISQIHKHMWNGIVTDFGIGFGMGQWANRDDFDEIGYYVCKDNKSIGVKVKDYILEPKKLPQSVSHYESIFLMRYVSESTAVIIITYESKAIVYNAKTGDIGDLASHNIWRFR